MHPWDKNDIQLHRRLNWREYQTQLQRQGYGKGFLSRFGIAICSVGIFFLLFYGIFIGVHALKSHLAQKENIDTLTSTPSPVTTLCKKDIQAWLTKEAIFNLEEKVIQQQVDEHIYQIETSLNLSLQKQMLEKIRSSKSRYIGFVALDPATGKVLSLAGVNKRDIDNNPCLDNSLPAASIFKIVTAAAAIEQCGFDPMTKFNFNGNKYTLYKSQLKDRVTRYTNTITFRDSFAQSVNPVFGKLGTRYLGRRPLEEYGAAFGFNREIGFETYLPPSTLTVSETPYQWAEIASGFNRETTLSPLHGALIAAAVLNEGRLHEPTIIETITDENGSAVYHGQATIIHQAMKARSSEILHQLMNRTVKSGTCRKAFRGSRKDRVLSKLKIGGKTGSIDNRSHDARIDWFVGFAEEKQGSGKIVVAVVVAHEKYIRTRAAEYAKFAFKQYFKQYFTENLNKGTNTIRQSG
jgi:penicillin-binding protein A